MIEGSTSPLLGLEGLLEQLMERAVLSALQSVPAQQVIREAVRKEFTAIRDELPTSIDDEQRMSVKRAAQLADVTPGTIRKWIKDGRLLAEGDKRSGYKITRAALNAAMALSSEKRSDIIDIDAEASKIVALNRKNRS